VTHFQVLYIKVGLLSKKERTEAENFFLYFKATQYYKINSGKIKEKRKENYEKNSEIKEKRKQNYENNSDKIKKRKKQNYEKNRAREYYSKSKKSGSDERVSKFKSAIEEGPHYICVCCNRCLYKRSVSIFDNGKYQKEGFKAVFSLVLSFNNIYYICKTCDKKLLKQLVPCQSVNNKLQLYDFPSDQGLVLNKLERILISQRILFTKIYIMPKGQFPKFKGSVCNISVQTESVCDLLPRSLNESGVLFIKLKRKLSFKSHVFSESVRPHILFSALNYLKKVNHLYEHVCIKDMCTTPEDFQVRIDDEDDFRINSDNCTESEFPLKFVNDENIPQIKTGINTDDEFEGEDPLNEYRLGCNETTLISNVLILLQMMKILL